MILRHMSITILCSLDVGKANTASSYLRRLNSALQLQIEGKSRGCFFFFQGGSAFVHPLNFPQFRERRLHFFN